MVNERGTDVQTKKLRVVLAKETTLKKIASLSDEELATQIELKKTYYKPRLRTLRAMAALYSENSSVLRDIDVSGVALSLCRRFSDESPMYRLGWSS